MQHKQKLPHFCFEVPPTATHQKWNTCGVSVFDLSLSNIMMKLYDVWSKDCSTPIRQTWNTTKLSISWQHPRLKNRNTMCFCFWPEQEMEKVPHLCIDDSMHSMDDTFSAFLLPEKSWVWMGVSWEMNMLIMTFNTCSTSRNCRISALRYHPQSRQ